MHLRHDLRDEPIGALLYLRRCVGRNAFEVQLRATNPISREP
jgi:hypothetical protein